MTWLLEIKHFWRYQIFKKLLLLTLLLIFISSCTTAPDHIRSEAAKIQFRSATSADLMNLPPPKAKIVAALYEFKDKTGQFKSSESGGSNSRAVTQGASVMVLQALEDSGWFIPIEREGLSNLLKERQLMDLSSTNELKTEQNPLIYSDIILEGGIISYETNVVTGGAGVRYLGVGGSNQFRQDRVTVYLRAISPKTGRILKTVSTSKTIISNKVDVGLYQYITPKNILEFETGYSSNEPPQLCVLEAIEKAVLALVIEGSMDNLWQFNSEDGNNSPVVVKYKKEKLESLYTPPKDTVRNRRSFSISCMGVASQIFSDYRETETTLGINGGVSYVLLPTLSLSAEVEKGELGPFGKLVNEYYSVSGGVKYHPKISSSIYPFASIGVGSINFIYNGARIWRPIFSGSLGLEFPIIKNTTISTAITYTFPMTDLIDNVDNGDLNDSYLSLKLGLSYYLERKNEK